MSFETNIPNHIKELNKKIRDLEYDRRRLIHDCDCELCDMQGEVTDENSHDYDAMGDQIKKIEDTIEALEAHAKLHNIKLEEKQLS